MSARVQRLVEHLALLARQGSAIPTHQEIALDLDWPHHAVWQALRDAEDAGLIRRVGAPLSPARRLEAGDGSWSMGRLPRTSERQCLRCRDPFVPPSRYRFCCDGCFRANAGEAA